MLTKQQLQKLKSANVLKDGEKGKTRIIEDYRSASKEAKETAAALAGIIGATMSNIKSRGTASAKTVLGLAQTLNVSPFYYSGETDEKSEFNEDILKRFLEENKLFAPVKTKRSSNRKKAESDREVKTGKPAKEKTKKEKAEKPAEKTKDKPVVKPEQPQGKIEIAAEAVVEETKPAAAPKAPKPAKDLSRDDMFTLVSALYICAELNEDARKKLDGIKAILLS